MTDINNSEIIAVIPMRKGSKGCVNKNISNILGKPLFYYSIAYANSLGIKALISTDYDRSLIEPLLNNNLFVARSKEFASDDCTMAQVLNDLFSRKIISKYSYCLLLQPTSPLRSTNLFLSVKNSFVNHDKKGLALTVKETLSSSWKTGVIKNGKLTNISKQNHLFFQNRQSLSKLFCPDGCMYLFSIKEYRKKQGFPIDNMLATVNDMKFNIDIDTIADLENLRSCVRSYSNHNGLEWLKKLNNFSISSSSKY